MTHDLINILRVNDVISAVNDLWPVPPYLRHDAMGQFGHVWKHCSCMMVSIFCCCVFAALRNYAEYMAGELRDCAVRCIEMTRQSLRLITSDWLPSGKLSLTQPSGLHTHVNKVATLVVCSYSRFALFRVCAPAFNAARSTSTQHATEWRQAGAYGSTRWRHFRCITAALRCHSNTGTERRKFRWRHASSNEWRKIIVINNWYRIEMSYDLCIHVFIQQDIMLIYSFTPQRWNWSICARPISCSCSSHVTHHSPTSYILTPTSVRLPVNQSHASKCAFPPDCHSTGNCCASFARCVSCIRRMTSWRGGHNLKVCAVKSIHLCRVLSSVIYSDCSSVAASANVTLNYVITFDNKVVPLERDCDVILVYDIQDGHFALTFDSTTQSLVLSTGDETYHITTTDPHTRTIQHDDVTVMYDESRDTFVVTLPWRLRGRVAGLLGTFALEENDEYLMANGSLTTNTEVVLPPTLVTSRSHL